MKSVSTTSFQIFYALSGARFLSRNRQFRDGHHSDRSHKSDILLPLRSLELTAKELPTIEYADCTFVFPH
jgi:hypothetical protein